jgi:predicted nucleotidyltransferase
MSSDYRGENPVGSVRRGWRRDAGLGENDIGVMNRDDVLARLRSHEPELKAAGIARLRLFGSVARGDQSAESDVDLLAEFDEAKSLSLIDVVGLENRLSDLLGVKVDLVQQKSLKPRVRSNAEREAVLAF